MMAWQSRLGGLRAQALVDHCAEPLLSELIRHVRRFAQGSALLEVTIMDWNRIEGNWKQAQGKIKEKWGKLTDDDLTMVNGQREQLEGVIQQRYGMAKDQVRKDVDAWLKSQP